MKNKPSANLLSDLMPQGDSEQLILKERAEHLSEELISTTQLIKTSNYVRFMLGFQGFYGIPFQYIKEIMLNTTPTKVPHTPDSIVGVINRHGELITIWDLKPFFNIKATEDAKKTHLIVVGALNITVAILADDIVGSNAYDPTSLDSPLATEDAIKPRYILGLDSGVTAILNIETLIHDLQSDVCSTKESKR